MRIFVGEYNDILTHIKSPLSPFSAG